MLPNVILHPDIITKILQAFENDPTASRAKYIQNTSFTKRETYNFGYDYFNLAKGHDTFIDIPSYLKTLCQTSIEVFGASYGLGKAEDYLNVIVSIYYKGYQLEPHVDVDFSERITNGKYVDFCFGENIIGVVLQPDSKGKFYILESEAEYPQFNPNNVIFLDEKPGTAFLLTGSLRHKPYYHGVDCVENLRISVTFRTVQLFK